jgi:uncharacterized protein YndB with AHSA1/START domain
MEAVTIKRSIWINAPRERVWQAVSEPEQIAAWFAPGMTFKMENNIVSILMDGQFIDVAWVEVLEPPRQLTTRPLPGKQTATTYLLEEENGGTRFTVTEMGLEALPADEREQYMERNGGEWEKALGNLNAYIEGKPLVKPEGF